MLQKKKNNRLLHKIIIVGKRALYLGHVYSKFTKQKINNIPSTWIKYQVEDYVRGCSRLKLLTNLIDWVFHKIESSFECFNLIYTCSHFCFSFNHDIVYQSIFERLYKNVLILERSNMALLPYSWTCAWPFNKSNCSSNRISYFSRLIMYITDYCISTLLS